MVLKIILQDCQEKNEKSSQYKMRTLLMGRFLQSLNAVAQFESQFENDL
jgi:hypothetical protein